MRPDSLARVAEWAAGGDSFDRCLANFLDGFYASPSAAALRDVPWLLASGQGDVGRIRDAYLAATAEELAAKHGLPVPDWTSAADRALRSPWFASSLDALRAVLLVESPAAFRARNLFVSENALSRA
jgi:hypothetical protein